MVPVREICRNINAFTESVGVWRFEVAEDEKLAKWLWVSIAAIEC